MNPTRYTRPPHQLQLGANTPYLRANNCAHKYCAGCPVYVALHYEHTLFGWGALLPVTSFEPACTVTSARHGEFGKSTPK